LTLRWLYSGYIFLISFKLTTSFTGDQAYGENQVTIDQDQKALLKAKRNLMTYEHGQGEWRNQNHPKKQHFVIKGF